MICPCCGSSQTRQRAILRDELIKAWRLASYEVDYINRQQGLHCLACGSNLRSMTLAKAIMSCFAYAATFKEFVRSEVAKHLRVLEINEAGSLTRFLKELPDHVLVTHPDVDMMNLPFGDAGFDLVVHSDTLEHVQRPICGLSECRRILKPSGFCVFTVPMIVDRLTASCEGLPPSFHDSPNSVVYSEYGADAWKHLMLAGFQECRIVSLEYPASQALVGVR